jgi:hypothetical protein
MPIPNSVYAVLGESSLTPHLIQVTVLAMGAEGAIDAAILLLSDDPTKLGLKSTKSVDVAEVRRVFTVHEVSRVCVLGITHVDPD